MSILKNGSRAANGGVEKSHRCIDVWLVILTSLHGISLSPDRCGYIISAKISVLRCTSSILRHLLGQVTDVITMT